VKRQTFRIRIRGDVKAFDGLYNQIHGIKEPEVWAEATGYVLGGWATRKGQYFWEFTELASGMLLNTWPCVETKAEALMVLEGLAAEGKVFLERRSKLAHAARTGQG
jgi:hypothetical protein